MSDDLNTISDAEDDDDTKKVSRLMPFVVDVEGYEGPIDVLLTLARDQKVDLIHISIVELADQYLEFVHKVSSTNLELAADYLVMAAWLAYLKSRLLLPDLNDEDEPSGEELAQALQFQLQRLESMQKAGETLMARMRLGQDFYSRGAPERFQTIQHSVFEASLTDLIQAYARQKSKAIKGQTLHIETSWELATIEDALVRLRSLVGHTPSWTILAKFLPNDIKNPLTRRSMLAANFGAVLQLAKEGRLNIRQDGNFGEIYFQTTSDWDKPFVHDKKIVNSDDDD
ncbi:MAG: segregation/condensation protein A [Rhodospirillaceae bacterium]|nr:MAG: segregation/condensation protein A [Rhodospirillaceae bacterium]